MFLARCNQRTDGTVEGGGWRLGELTSLFINIIFLVFFHAHQGLILYLMDCYSTTIIIYIFIIDDYADDLIILSNALIAGNFHKNKK